MALVNPQIAMSYRPTTEYQPRNALAEYAQIQQIMGGQRQAELAQYQLEAARRADQSASIQNELYARHFDPETGAINAAAFAAEAAKRGQGGILPGFFKTEAERQTAAQALRKSKVETETAELGLQQKKFRQAWENAGAADTPQLAIEQLTKAVRNGEIDMTSASQQINQLQNMQPDQYRQWRISKIAQFLDAKDRVAMMQPKIARQESGGEIVSFQDNPALPGYGLPAAGIPRIVKTATIGETTAQGQLTLAQQRLAWEQANPGFEIKEGENGFLLAVNKRTGVAKPVTMGELNAPVKGSTTAQGQLTLAQQRLAFDQQKFAYEKANPGYELKEGGDGTIYAVNKRTLQATPVTVGGAPNALAPAPGAANALVPGAAPGAAPAAAPSAPTPAVSAAPGAVTPGTPLKGKGSSLTETQSNAVAFGMRMADADATLRNLESSGVTSGGRIRGFVEGALTSLVPFQGEQLAQGAGAVVNTLPGALGGPSAEQQQYAQAKLNFVTAVLRKESGAAISPAEFANEDKKYFPQAGDSDKVVQQKRRARELAIQAMKVQAGPGGKDIGVANDPNDPLGLRKK
jgi:hypothetical protein